jgi:hypothetical protein
MSEHSKSTQRNLFHGVIGIASLGLSRVGLLVPIQTLRVQFQLECSTNIDFYSLATNKDSTDIEPTQSDSPFQYYAWKENVAYQFSSYVAQYLTSKYISPITPIPQAVSALVAHPVEIVYLLSVAKKLQGSPTVHLKSVTRKKLLLNPSVVLSLVHKVLVASVSEYLIAPRVRSLLEDYQAEDALFVQHTTRMISNLISKILFVPLEIKYRRDAVDSLTETRRLEKVIRPEFVPTVIKSVLLTLIEEPAGIMWYYLYRFVNRATK